MPDGTPKAAISGLIYATAFVSVMGGLLFWMLPHLNITRPAACALMLIAVLSGGAVGVRDSLKRTSREERN